MQTCYFVARIHGRAEIPKTIVLYPQTYELLKGNSVYKDFLLSLLTTRPCLFLGFSFLDPAITHVLKDYEETGPSYPTLHLALLPNTAPKEMCRRLSDLNIQTLSYDDSKAHRDLWRAISSARDHLKNTSATPSRVATPATKDIPSPFHLYLAFAYAQQETTKEQKSLLTMTVDGIVMSALRQSPENWQTLPQIAESVKVHLHVSVEELSPALQESLGRLITTQRVETQNGKFRPTSKTESALQRDLEALAQGVVDRVLVVAGAKTEDLSISDVASVIERSLMIRSWDLAAHYAGGATAFVGDVGKVVQESVAASIPKLQGSRRIAFENACVDLFTSPTESEAIHVAELSRTAFALQLVLGSPRQSLLQKFVLPTRVYFDASVLMPAIVPGHVLRPVYMDAIRRLCEAAQGVGCACSLSVGYPFLNEIVTHRKLSLDLARELDVDRHESLRKLFALYGAENTNVFISAFASHVEKAHSDKKTAPRFHQFLRQHAPYETEEQLANFIRKHGFEIAQMDMRHRHNHEFVIAFNPLLTAYEEDNKGIAHPNAKDRILIEHEAIQIAQLDLDSKNGQRSVFVTADRRFRRALLRSTNLRRFSGLIVSPEGFVGLIDIMVGIKADHRSLARLIWGTPRTESETMIRDYLVRRALAARNAALARAMPEVIDDMVTSAAAAAAKQALDLRNTATPDDVARSVRFMDRVEDEFYSKMRWWLEQNATSA